MNAILVTRIDFDVDIDATEDCPYTQELMCVFISDENYTAEEKAKDYISYVTSNGDTHEVGDEIYPQYDIKYIRCY